MIKINRMRLCLLSILSRFWRGWDLCVWIGISMSVIWRRFGRVWEAIRRKW